MQTNLSNIQQSSQNIIVTANPADSADDSVKTDSFSFFVTMAASAADIGSNSDIQADDVIYLGSEAMKIISNTDTTNGNIQKLTVIRGFGDTTVTEHASGTILQKSSDNTIPAGGFPEGIYEFSYTLVDYSGDETLPHTPESTTAVIGVGQFFKT